LHRSRPDTEVAPEDEIVYLLKYNNRHLSAGPGGVICLVDHLLPLTPDISAMPVSFI